VVSRGDNPLERFLSRTGPLYTVPAVALEVTALADDPRADAAALRACIERDAALTAKMLRVVNSSLYAPARKVADLTQAVALLGVKAVKLLALGFCLPDRMFDARASSAVVHYWQRTLLRAVAARRLAQALNWKEGDEAFVAALLADVGVAVLLQEATEEYLPLYEGIQQGNFEPLVAERRVFEFDRVQLTRRLLQSWRLPASIIDSIDEARDGGDPHRSLRRTARLIYVSELLAAVILDDRADLWHVLGAAAERHLRLPADALAETAAAIEAETAELAGMFQFPSDDRRTMRDAAERAGALLPDASEAVVGELLSRYRRPYTNESADDSTNDDAPALSFRRSAVQSTAVARTTQTLRTRAAISPEQLRPLFDNLRSAAVACRRDRSPLSLCLVEAEGSEDATDASAIAIVVAACAAVDWPGALVTAVGPRCTALVLPRCERRQALDIFEELRFRFRKTLSGDAIMAKLSGGIATVGLPPRDYDVGELAASAERCLLAARSSAGDAAKSIESY